ncbi:MAG: alpha/beta hydrolase [Verrucomicrobiota bacterium]
MRPLINHAACIESNSKAVKIMNTSQFVTLIFTIISMAFLSVSDSQANPVRYAKENVEGVNIFYREAGDPVQQAVALLHGFPSSSYQYREVLAGLGDEFYILAPDYPGFGYSDKPGIEEYSYSFDSLAKTIGQFLKQKGVIHYFLMVHDYGAPIGFRLATEAPEKLAGLIVMNGNIYQEGLSPLARNSLSQARTPEDEVEKIKSFMSLEGIKWMYTSGVKNPNTISPDSWHFDYAILEEPHVTALNLELLYDYPNNVQLYPVWQKFLRDQQPPTLIVWGKNDPIFPESGAIAYKDDLKKIDYHIYDTGHFPLEDYADDIIEKIRGFLNDQSNQNTHDARALISKVVEANGGAQALRRLSDVSFDYTFRIKNTDAVDTSHERYIFEGEISYAEYSKREVYAVPQLSGSYTQFFNGTQTVSKLNGNLITEQQPAQVGHALRRTNYYWFAMMFKLLDPGVNHKLLPTRIVDGISYKIVEITFGDNIGDVKDRFVLYVNPETYKVDQFLYTAVGFGVTDPSLMKVKYEEINGVYLTTYRKYAPADWEGNVIKDFWTEQLTENVTFNTGFDTTTIQGPMEQSK